MTPSQADRIIRNATLVTVRSEQYDETFQAVFVSRDRRTITSSKNGLFDRADLKIVSEGGASS